MVRSMIFLLKRSYRKIFKLRIRFTIEMKIGPNDFRYVSV